MTLQPPVTKDRTDGGSRLPFGYLVLLATLQLVGLVCVAIMFARSGSLFFHGVGVVAILIAIFMLSQLFGLIFRNRMRPQKSARGLSSLGRAED